MKPSISKLNSNEYEIICFYPELNLLPNFVDNSVNHVYFHVDSLLWIDFIEKVIELKTEYLNKTTIHIHIKVLDFEDNNVFLSYYSMLSDQKQFEEFNYGN